MGIIAVAGGTSPSLSRCIVTAIAKTSNTPIVISRTNPTKSQPLSFHGAEVRCVDYASHASLVSAFKGVETVISVIKIPGPAWASYQINLLNAAVAAGRKRFEPSGFEFGPLADGRINATEIKSVVWQACKEIGLEVARFSNGMFINYLGMGCGMRGKERLASQGLVEEAIIWDVKGRTAEVPVKDNGTFPRITLTNIGDVRTFVAAACELEMGRWEEDMGIVGQTPGVDQVTEMLEAVVGAKFEVKTVGRSKLQERANSVNGIGRDRQEVLKKMISQIELVMLEEKESVAVLHPVTNRLCPAVKPLTISDSQ